MTINNLTIEIKKTEPVFVIAKRRKIPISEISTLITELYGILDAKGCKATGPVMTFYNDLEFDPNDMDIEICIPIEETALGVADSKVVPGNTYASTLYHGPYAGIGAGYAAIMQWMQDNDYTISGASGEVYHVTPDQTNHENEIVTEIRFPVVKM